LNSFHPSGCAESTAHQHDKIVKSRYRHLWRSVIKWGFDIGSRHRRYWPDGIRVPLSKTAVEGLVSTAVVGTSLFAGYSVGGNLGLTISSFGAGVIGNVIGAMTDRAYCAGADWILTRLTGGSEVPPNHDLARAIRLSQIRAVEAIARRVVAKVSEDNLGNLTKPELDTFLKAILTWKKHAESDLRAHALENLTSASVQTVAQNVRALLDDPTPHDGRPERRVLKLWCEAGKKLLEELHVFWLAERTIFYWAKRDRPIVLPQLFSSIMQMEGDVDGVSLANAAQAFFAEYLKNDQRLFSLVTIEMLRTIGLENEELANTIATHGTHLSEEFQKQLGPIGAALREIDTHVEQLAHDQKEEFALLRSRIDVLLAMLSTQPSPAMSVERWAAAEYVSTREGFGGCGEVAEQVRDLLDQNSKAFIGRETDLAKLDAFVENNPRGLATVIAPAGYGKSALLTAWISHRREEGDFVARHFIARRKLATVGVIASLKHLLCQIRAYRGEFSSSTPESEYDLEKEISSRLNVPAAPKERLIVVLDGIDESDGFFPGFGCRKLGQGIYIVLGVRAQAKPQPKLLKPWLDVAPHDLPKTPLDLGPLSSDDLHLWLRTAIAKPIGLDDRAIIAALERATDRIPLFLRFMIESLVERFDRNTSNAAKISLESIPVSFTDYVRNELDNLHGLGREAWGYDVRMLFAVLTQVLAPIAVQELRSISREFRELNLKGLDHRVERWLAVAGTDQQRTYIFAHQKLAEVFAGLLDETEEARNCLCEHCERTWNIADNNYALVFAPDHLIQAAAREGWSKESIGRAARPLTSLEFHQRRLHFSVSDLMARSVMQLRTLAEKAHAVS
jgi:hypothetical protein